MRIIKAISVVFNFVIVQGDSNENSSESDSVIDSNDSGQVDNQIQRLFNRMERNFDAIFPIDSDEGYNSNIADP